MIDIGSGWIGVADVARVALFVAGVILAGSLTVIALDPGNVRGRRFAAAGAAVALIVLAGSRLERLGEPIAWQLVGSVAAYGLFVAAFLTYRRDGNGRIDR